MRLFFLVGGFLASLTKKILPSREERVGDGAPPELLGPPPPLADFHDPFTIIAPGAQHLNVERIEVRAIILTGHDMIAAQLPGNSPEVAIAHCAMIAASPLGRSSPNHT